MAAHPSVTEQIEAAKAWCGEENVKRPMATITPSIVREKAVTSPIFSPIQHVCACPTLKSSSLPRPIDSSGHRHSVHCHSSGLPSTRNHRSLSELNRIKTGLSGTPPADHSRGDSTLHSARLPLIRLRRRLEQTSRRGPDRDRPSHSRGSLQVRRAP